MGRSITFNWFIEYFLQLAGFRNTFWPNFSTSPTTRVVTQLKKELEAKEEIAEEGKDGKEENNQQNNHNTTNDIRTLFLIEKTNVLSIYIEKQGKTFFWTGKVFIHIYIYINIRKHQRFSTHGRVK